MSEPLVDYAQLIPVLKEIGPAMVARFFQSAAALQEVRPASLFHYTNLAGLRGIIEGKELWATNCRYLNDPRELNHGKDLTLQPLKAYLEIAPDEHREFGRTILGLFEHIPVNDHLFAFCLCTAKDDLNQWRHYGDNGKGIVIEFDTEALVGSLFSGVLVPIIYEASSQRDLLIEFFKNLQTELSGLARPESPQVDSGYRGLASCIGWVMNVKLHWGLFKDAAFSSEREWRVLETVLPSLTLPASGEALFALTPDEENKMTVDLQTAIGKLPRCVGQGYGVAPQRFRERGGVLVPYVALPLAADKPLPIRRILLGPNYHDPFSDSTMRDYLRVHGWGSDIDIESVRLPMKSA